MKKIVIFVLLCTVVTFSQERRYFDTPMGGGGGYTPGWYIHNLDPVNQKLNLAGMPSFSKSGFYSSGGAGFIYLMFVPNLRVGGMGFGGSSSEKSESVGIVSQSEFSFAGGGLTIEYTLPFIKQIGVSVGGIIGGASQSIKIYRNSKDFNWDNIWGSGSPYPLINGFSRTIDNNYWILSPTLNIDIPFYRFFIFRIGGGYNFSLGNNWTADNDVDLKGVPSDLNGDGFFIQTGIFAGFFSF